MLKLIIGPSFRAHTSASIDTVLKNGSGSAVAAILDHVTPRVDPHTEAISMAALSRLCQDLTAF